jgi:NAD(P)-dependent dehydrogenase (short-subunit alcohol dehydrogenase family)
VSLSTGPTADSRSTRPASPCLGPTIPIAPTLGPKPAAKETLAQVRKRGSDGVLVRADVTRPDHITDMFRKVKTEFGRIDIFVSNARPEVSAFFQPPWISPWNSGTPHLIPRRRPS